MQIKITDITPFMRKGWVAMDKDKRWWWYNKKPYKWGVRGYWLVKNGEQGIIDWDTFDIAPADDWTKSLIKIDNTAREKFEEEYQNNIQRTIKELKQND